MIEQVLLNFIRMVDVSVVIVVVNVMMNFTAFGRIVNSLCMLSRHTSFSYYLRFLTVKRLFRTEKFLLLYSRSCFSGVGEGRLVKSLLLIVNVLIVIYRISDMYPAWGFVVSIGFAMAHSVV